MKERSADKSGRQHSTELGAGARRGCAGVAAAALKRD